MQTRPRSPGLYKLFATGKLLTYDKGEVIDSTDKPSGLTYILSGYIKRYMIANDGRLGIQIIYGPEDVLPLTWVYQALLGQSLYDGPETYYFSALGQTRLLYIETDVLVRAIQQEPLLYKELFSESGRHLKGSVHNLENITLRDTHSRVAHQLAFFCKEFGETTDAGTLIHLPLTHQDIADIIGSTRESVTRAIGILRDLNILHDGRQLIVTDLGRLLVEAYDPHG